MVDMSTSTWPETDAERAAFSDWQDEVANGDTLRGFRAWLADKETPEFPDFSMDDDRGPNARFEMFSKEGNDACARLVGEVVESMHSAAVTRLALPSLVNRKMAEVGGTFPEVYDTEPASQICAEISAVCAELGWMHLDRFGEL